MSDNFIVSSPPALRRSTRERKAVKFYVPSHERQSHYRQGKDPNSDANSGTFSLSLATTAPPATTAPSQAPSCPIKVIPSLAAALTAIMFPRTGAPPKRHKQPSKPRTARQLLAQLKKVEEAQKKAAAAAKKAIEQEKKAAAMQRRAEEAAAAEQKILDAGLAGWTLTPRGCAGVEECKVFFGTPISMRDEYVPGPYTRVKLQYGGWMVWCAPSSRLGIWAVAGLAITLQMVHDHIKDQWRPGMVQLRTN
ncbi:hypothetical protein CspeluHIS016_0702820 [Cutaneotrichosporon spelunceum]|uniref:Uncharacterized protein n=1 Tax=Cutaneotrichosporon spelunceum TaxID=1672016 RepID=A0AAD3TYL1_9TREE|nr:hypothetical protein CspeluHIS016_0702820 [Cutaneotrichosporon spelunceum]